MELPKLKATVGRVLALLGVNKLPINAETNTTDFSAEQKEKLEEALGAKLSAEAIEALDKEIKAVLENDLDLKAIQDEVRALLAIAQSEENINNNDDLAEPKATSTPTQEMSADEALKELKMKIEEKDKLIAKLIVEPEGDVKPSTGTAMTKQTFNHSATHLFATGKQWDAFDKRPWNERARDLSAKASNFDTNTDIPLLENDVEHFVRENPNALNSLFVEHYKLPKEWSYRTGVLDRVADGHIIAAEIVQGRAPGWSPKNNFLIEPEEGQVYRKKIDVTFDGYQLQEIENTWIRSYNKEGSHPYKMSFIYFLLSELVKQQAADDTNAQINGIYVKNPGGDNKPGAAVNSQNGLLFLYWKFRDVQKKYRATKLGQPTSENIVDYIKKLVESIPEEHRNKNGLEIQLSETWLRAYRERAGALYQHNYNTDTGKYEYKGSHVIDYPNIIFQPLAYMVRTDFMAITYSDNIQVMDYMTNEKSKFTVTHVKRNTDIFADYRLGIRIKFVGTKIAEGDPRVFEVQRVWSNDVPIFPSDVSIPLYDTTTGIIKLDYPAVKVNEDWKTDITDIENVQPGQVVKIYGNKSLAGAKAVKKNAKFDLTSDYPLNTDGVLTLLVKSDKTLKEISRTTAAPVVNPVIDFTEGIIEIEGGSQFAFAGDASKTLTEILGGVEGNSIKIFGSDTADVELTIGTTGNISTTSAAILKTKAEYVELINVEGKWFEINRSIQ